ncbi:hypothetical protein [Nocardia mikamii]|uniref:hypothetical protein n=1 Tax=Nocardia mikamii TaxID=508464 RepID=UPI0007A42FF3|nr:hypothetical protein [Nocardia mikamii]
MTDRPHEFETRVIELRWYKCAQADTASPPRRTRPSAGVLGADKGVIGGDVRYRVAAGAQIIGETSERIFVDKGFSGTNGRNRTGLDTCHRAEAVAMGNSMVASRGRLRTP